MDKFINWLTTSFTPKVTKITQNPWVRALQRTMVMTLPMILIGSVINLIGVISQYLTFIPDISMIYNFTFNILGLFVAFIIAYQVMENKRLNNLKITAALISVGVYLLFVNPNINLYGETTIDFSRLGPQGMIVAITGGFFVSAVLIMFKDFSFFSKDSAMPDFVRSWFDLLVPIFVAFLIPWILVHGMNIDVFNAINGLFAPLANSAETLPGFVFLCFLHVFFYSMGISGWTMSAVAYPIFLSHIAINAELVAQGLAPTMIATTEVFYSGWCTLGGLGCTLPLVIMMYRSKSKRLKALGKSTLIPSLVNINEPVVYGTPIVWNPTLMIPMWINGALIPAITFLVLRAGWVTIPSQVFGLQFIPYGVSTFLVNYDYRGLILLVVLIVIMTMVWYPFFKAFENTEIAKESETTA